MEIRIGESITLQEIIKEVYDKEVSLEDCGRLLYISNNNDHNVKLHENNIIFTNFNNYEITFNENMLSMTDSELNTLFNNNNINSFNDDFNFTYIKMNSEQAEYALSIIDDYCIPYIQVNNPGIFYANSMITNYAVTNNRYDLLENNDQYQQKSKELLDNINNTVTENDILPKLFREV